MIPGLHDNTKFEDCITRTCGGDPGANNGGLTASSVLPAHAGVIHTDSVFYDEKMSITRTCGGDPNREVS